jgi:hypothetical protein
MHRLSSLPALAAAALVAVPAVAGAQDPDLTDEPALRAMELRAGEELRLDGLLDEAFWSRAIPIVDFRQREPLEGVAATERTEVRIVWNDEAMYVGVRALDSNPERVVARVMQRDQVMSGNFGGLSFQGDDGVALVLDPFDDDRNGFVFATNPNGALFDALLTDEGGQVNVDWQAVWEVAGSRTAEGWSAEFAIPWRTLRYPGDGRDWGLNVLRFVGRKQEEALWKSWDREGGGFERISLAGRLQGLDGLPRSRVNVEMKPFVLGGTRGVRTVPPIAGDIELPPGELEYSGELDAGLDLKSEVVPGLVLDLTVNTDFAQVEVDDQQVNLTRFNLFFPERRDFFLENAGIFDFGQRGFFGPPPFLMFFSRRIGIGDEGEVPIVAGGRLTGRVGGQTVGLLSVATDAAAGQGEEVFNVARVKRDVGASNYIGAMVTDRRGDGPANTLAGVDARWFVHPTAVAEAFVARSFTEGEGGDGVTWRTGLNWTTDLWGGFASLFQVDEELEAASGFVNRRNIRQASLNLRRSWRPEVLDIRKIDLRVGGDWITTTDGRFQDSQVDLSFSPNFNSGDDISVRHEWGRSQVDDAFTLADTVFVPAGEYSIDGWNVRLSGTDARALSGSLNIGAGDFFGGRIQRWRGELTFIPSPVFALNPGFQRNKVTLPGGDFTADITSLRLTWAPSPLITTTANIQYNGLTDQVVTNVRFNFIHRPGSDLFVVFSEDRFEDGAVWRTDDRGLVVKLTYLMRF